jgi:hypothetical protein
MKWFSKYFPCLVYISAQIEFRLLSMVDLFFELVFWILSSASMIIFEPSSVCLYVFSCFSFGFFLVQGPGWLNESDYLTTHTILSPKRRGFAPGFVNYKKGCTRLAAASDQVYQLLVHGRWFSPGTPASSTTKTGRHDIAEILLKVALSTKKIKINQINFWVQTVLPV